MTETSIVSRPVYQPLKLRAARQHLMVADGEGADCVLAILEGQERSILDSCFLYYVHRQTEDAHRVERLRKLAPASLVLSHTFASLAFRLRALMGNLRAGVQVYLAGTEGRVAQALQIVEAAGIDHQSVQQEHRGSLERRVQCVHCKGITDHVQTQPFHCSHCGLLLLVRDHYSRRIGAFQGVCINAEDSNETFELQPLFP